MGSDISSIVPARHTRHTVTGELDVATVHDLRRRFTAALDQPALDGPALDLDLDLAGVTFMDAAGLGAVMWCRRRALDAGRACIVDAASPAALRLMRLTGTHDLLRGHAVAPV